MKKSELATKTLKELKALALKMGIKKPSVSRRSDLITEIFAADKIKKGRVKKTTPKSSSDKDLIIQKKAATHQTFPGVKFAAKTPSVSDKSTEPLKEKKSEAPSSPTPPRTHSPYDDLGDLPESYGTGRLFFTARDPQWLYAYWDYSWQQLEEMRRMARNGELKLRIHAGSDSQSPICQEITMNPAARSWFLKVDQSNANYYAEFGYEDRAGHFIAASRSRPIHTPPDRMSHNTQSNFVTIPFHIRFHQLFKIVKSYFKQGEALADVLYRLQMKGFHFPFEYFKEKDWNVDQSERLSRLFGGDVLRLLRTGSLEVTHWLRPTSSGALK